MELTEILKKQRSFYVDEYSKYMATAENTLAEFILEHKSDEIETLFRIKRYDIARQEGEVYKVAEFDREGIINHEPITFEVGDKKIHLSPLVWNAVTFNFDDLDNSFEQILKWAYKWIDITKENKNATSELRGVIHQMSKPTYKENTIQFHIDFGSAPVEAFVELVAILLSDTSLKQLSIGSEVIIESA